MKLFLFDTGQKKRNKSDYLCKNFPIIFTIELIGKKKWNLLDFPCDKSEDFL